MTDKMQVALSLEAAAPVWGLNALLSFDATRTTVHLSSIDDLVRAQQAGRKLEMQGIRKISLVGKAWSLETAWAFYQGLKVAKPIFELEAAELTAEDAKALKDRIVAVEWVCQMINGTAERSRSTTTCRESGGVY